MSVKVLTFAAAFASIVVAAGQALSAEPTPVGLWQAVDDDTKQPTGWFLIRDHGGVYDGIIAKMILKPGEDPNEPCVQCKDDRHNHPWLGLEIPRDGKIYKATMKVTPDGQTLIVRGYIGFELLGQNQYWTRLPDSAYSALDPAVNPNPAANPNPAVNPKRPAPPRKSETPLPKPESIVRR